MRLTKLKITVSIKDAMLALEICAKAFGLSATSVCNYLPLAGAVLDSDNA